MSGSILETSCARRGKCLKTVWQTTPTYNYDESLKDDLKVHAAEIVSGRLIVMGGRYYNSLPRWCYRSLVVTSEDHP